MKVKSNICIFGIFTAKLWTFALEVHSSIVLLYSYAISYKKKGKEQIGEAAAASRFSPLFWYGSRLVVRSREDYSAALLKRGIHIHMLKSALEKIIRLKSFFTKTFVQMIWRMKLFVNWKNIFLKCAIRNQFDEERKNSGEILCR